LRPPQGGKGCTTGPLTALSPLDMIEPSAVGLPDPAVTQQDASPMRTTGNCLYDPREADSVLFQVLRESARLTSHDDFRNWEYPHCLLARRAT
jgi:hypothetical protein